MEASPFHTNKLYTPAMLESNGAGANRIEPFPRFGYRIVNIFRLSEPDIPLASKQVSRSISRPAVHQQRLSRLSEELVVWSGHPEIERIGRDICAILTVQKECGLTPQR
jgi:hypothetical protein